MTAAQVKMGEEKHSGRERPGKAPKIRLLVGNREEMRLQKQPVAAAEW